MKKPNWHSKLYRNGRWRWFPSFLKSPLHWKEKFETVRIELIPTIQITWGWWSLEFTRGSYIEWELYIWTKNYCGGDIQKAIDTWPWGKIENGKWVRTNPLNI